MKNILVTGGAGYVGAILVPKLLNTGYNVKVIDWYIFGDDVLAPYQKNPRLKQIRGDIRDIELLKREIPGCDAVIHLACISNDPSFELNPRLGKSVNYDAFIPLVDIAKKTGVKRFIYASSSSVYGVKETPNVTEDMQLEPLTDYSKFKAQCEDYLLKQQSSYFTTLILRPATVCGYSPRMRLDLTVNILTNHAVNNKNIRVFGGKQKRPNIHIQDITDLYIKCLAYPKEKIAGRIFNAGFQNQTVNEIAEIVRRTVGEKNVKILHEPSNDNRSYHISSEKIKQVLGYTPQHTIQNAIQDVKQAFEEGKIPNAMEDKRYYNIKTMNASSVREDWPQQTSISISKKTMLELLEGMLRIRKAEEKIVEVYDKDKSMRTPTHLSIGQEAVTVGVCQALRKADQVFTGHRCHAAYLAKGGSWEGFFTELCGRKDGICQGRAGSAHLTDHGAKIYASPILSAMIPVAVGAALSFQIDKSKNIAVAFFGDAAIEEGVFAESLNFAVLKRLPILLICENNLYSTHSPLKVRQPPSPIYERIKLPEMPTHQHDGNDIIEVYESAKNAVDQCRKGNGPVLIEYLTYRIREHVGPNMDYDRGYRSKKEVEQWIKKCPIKRYEKRLLKDKIMTEGEIQLLVKRFELETDMAYENAVKSPWPEEDSLVTGVY